MKNIKSNVLNINTFVDDFLKNNDASNYQYNNNLKLKNPYYIRNFETDNNYKKRILERFYDIYDYGMTSYIGFENTNDENNRLSDNEFMLAKLGKNFDYWRIRLNKDDNENTKDDEDDIIYFYPYRLDFFKEQDIPFLFPYFDSNELKELQQKDVIEWVYDKFTSKNPKIILASPLLELIKNYDFLPYYTFPIYNNKTINELEKYTFLDFDNKDLWIKNEDDKKILPTILTIKNIVRYFDTPMLKDEEEQIKDEMHEFLHNFGGLRNTPFKKHSRYKVDLYVFLMILIKIKDNIDDYIFNLINKFKELNEVLKTTSYLNIDGIFVRNVKLIKDFQTTKINNLLALKSNILNILANNFIQEQKEANTLYNEYEEQLNTNEYDDQYFNRDFLWWLENKKQIRDGDYTDNEKEELDKKVRSLWQNIQESISSSINNIVYFDALKKQMYSYLASFLSTKNALDSYNTQLNDWYENIYYLGINYLNNDEDTKLVALIDYMNNELNTYQKDYIQQENFKEVADFFLDLFKDNIDFKAWNDELALNVVSLDENFEEMFNKIDVLYGYFDLSFLNELKINKSIKFYQNQLTDLIYNNGISYNVIKPDEVDEGWLSLDDIKDALKKFYFWYKTLYPDYVLHTKQDLINKEKENVSKYNELLNDESISYHISNQDFIYNEFNKNTLNVFNKIRKHKKIIPTSDVKSKELASLIAFLKNIYHKDFNKDDFFFLYDVNKNLYFNLNDKEQIIELFQAFLQKHKCAMINIFRTQHLYEIINYNNKHLKQEKQVFYTSKPQTKRR